MKPSASAPASTAASASSKFVTPQILTLTLIRFLLREFVGCTPRSERKRTRWIRGPRPPRLHCSVPHICLALVRGPLQRAAGVSPADRSATHRLMLPRSEEYTYVLQ